MDEDGLKGPGAGAVVVGAVHGAEHEMTSAARSGGGGGGGRG